MPQAQPSTRVSSQRCKKAAAYQLEDLQHAAYLRDNGPATRSISATDVQRMYAVSAPPSPPTACLLSLLSRWGLLVYDVLCAVFLRVLPCVVCYIFGEYYLTHGALDATQRMHAPHQHFIIITRYTRGACALCVCADTSPSSGRSVECFRGDPGLLPDNFRLLLGISPKE